MAFSNARGQHSISFGGTTVTSSTPLLAVSHTVQYHNNSASQMLTYHHQPTASYSSFSTGPIGRARTSAVSVQQSAQGFTECFQFSYGPRDWQPGWGEGRTRIARRRRERREEDERIALAAAHSSLGNVQFAQAPSHNQNFVSPTNWMPEPSFDSGAGRIKELDETPLSSMPIKMEDDTRVGSSPVSGTFATGSALAPTFPTPHRLAAQGQQSRVFGSSGGSGVGFGASSNDHGSGCFCNACAGQRIQSPFGMRVKRKEDDTDGVGFVFEATEDELYHLDEQRSTPILGGFTYKRRRLC